MSMYGRDDFEQHETDRGGDLHAQAEHQWRAADGLPAEPEFEVDADDFDPDEYERDNGVAYEGTEHAEFDW